MEHADALLRIVAAHRILAASPRDALVRIVAAHRILAASPRDELAETCRTALSCKQPSTGPAPAVYWAMARALTLLCTDVTTFPVKLALRRREGHTSCRNAIRHGQAARVSLGASCNPANTRTSPLVIECGPSGGRDGQDGDEDSGSRAASAASANNAACLSGSGSLRECENQSSGVVLLVPQSRTDREVDGKSVPAVP